MLTGERIREAFKEYLVTGDITKEMNYTIFFAGKTHSDLPVQLFKAYKPKISDHDLKGEIKKLMMPFYANLETKEQID